MNIYMEYAPIVAHFGEKDAMGWLDNFYPELTFDVEDDVLEVEGDEDEVLSFANHMYEVSAAFEDLELEMPLLHDDYKSTPF